MKKIRQPQTFPLIDTGVIGGFELNVRSGNNFKFLFFLCLSRESQVRDLMLDRILRNRLIKLQFSVNKIRIFEGMIIIRIRNPRKSELLFFLRFRVKIDRIEGRIDR